MKITELPIRQLVLAALFAALLAVSGQITIPVGPAPITLQTLVVMLTGLLLGSRLGPLSVSVLLALSALGLPLLSGGSGGIAYILGPTGGFILSWIVASFVIGWLAETWGKNGELKIFQLTVINLMGGIIIVYLIGVPWLMKVANLSLTWENFTKVCLIFIPGDLLKAILAAFLANILYKVDPKLKPRSL